MHSTHKEAGTLNKIVSIPFSSSFINKEQNIFRLSVPYAQSDFKPDRFFSNESYNILKQ